MPTDTTLPGAIGWTLWYAGEIAFKWVPGFAISLMGSESSGAVTPLSSPPTITQPVSVTDVVHFLQANSAPGVYEQIYQNWNIFVGISMALSFIFAAILIYSVTRLFQLRQEEYKHFQAHAHSVAHHDVPKTRLRWDRIVEQAGSESDQNRRLAILEADIMLGELLDDLGYRGETLADKMRQVHKSDFNTIDQAWEAHRARNTVAHTADHHVSVHDANRIIGLYDKVFREFGFVEEVDPHAHAHGAAHTPAGAHHHPPSH
jgi:hypothetical protein